jgi:hypothetical protein
MHAGVRAAFPGHSVSTVTEAGWRGSRGGSLLALAERGFDVFVTIDRKFEHHNDLRAFALGFVIVRVASNTLAACVPGFDRLRGRGSGSPGRGHPLARVRAVRFFDNLRRLVSILDWSPQEAP